MVQPSKLKGKRQPQSGTQNSKRSTLSIASPLAEGSSTSIPVSPISLRDAYRSLLSGNPPSYRPSPLTPCFHVLPYPRGIINNSNYCFMNSILQALIFTPPVAHLAVSAMDESALCPTLSTLGRWMMQYWKPALTRLCCQPPRLPFTMSGQSVSNASRGVDGSIQEDAQEFLQRLLEIIHTELRQLEMSWQAMWTMESERMTNTSKGKSSRVSLPANTTTQVSEAEKGWTTVKGKEKLTIRTHDSREGRSLLLDSVFGGTLDSHLKGKSKQRNHASVVVEPFYSLAIDVGFSMECRIEDAIERTLSTERIYDTGHDKELRKTLLLNKLPNILFLHLRRWAMTAEGDLVKLDNTVRFGKMLVLPRCVCADEELSNKSRTYKLLSAVAYRGSATTKGHYVTYLVDNVANPFNLTVRNDSLNGVVLPKSDTTSRGTRHAICSDHVVMCDDAKVDLCDMTTLQKATVYFLVYQRVSNAMRN